MSRYARPPSNHTVPPPCSVTNTPPLATIEVSYPLFVIHTNHVTTLPETPLHALCTQIYTAALTNLALTPLAPILPLRAILTATFDPAHRAFVLEDTATTPQILATLSEDARATIFAQAIAGIVSCLRAVALSGASTAEAVEATLRRFEKGAARTAMLAAVEAWSGWADCFEKAQIGGMIMEVVGIEAGGEKLAAQEVSVIEVDELAEAPALFNDGPHLRRDFGVPDAFTIMALN